MHYRVHLTLFSVLNTLHRAVHILCPLRPTHCADHIQFKAIIPQWIKRIWNDAVEGLMLYLFTLTRLCLQSMYDTCTHCVVYLSKYNYVLISAVLAQEHKHCGCPFMLPALGPLFWSECNFTANTGHCIPQWWLP